MEYDVSEAAINNDIVKLLGYLMKPTANAYLFFSALHFLLCSKSLKLKRQKKHISTAENRYKSGFERNNQVNQLFMPDIKTS